MEKLFDVDAYIGKVPDFPKPGILFYDITPLFKSPQAYEQVIMNMKYQLCKSKIFPTKIAALESRGFLFATTLGYLLNVPVVLVRKAGKLPNHTLSKSYALEYGTATIEVQKQDISVHDDVVLVDDLIATGGTLEAARSLIEDMGAHVSACVGLIGLPNLGYKDKLVDLPVLVQKEYFTKE